jgi:hypothetical protein
MIFIVCNDNENEEEGREEGILLLKYRARGTGWMIQVKTVWRDKLEILLESLLTLKMV